MSVTEIIARAICAGDENLPSHWDDYTPSAHVVITALEAAGYAIVPIEPTADMLASVDDEDSDKYVARGRAYSAWKAMIATHIEGGTK